LVATLGNNSAQRVQVCTGRNQRGEAACAHHQGKGFSRETVGFLLNGASFGTFLSPGREKYIKTNIKQTDKSKFEKDLPIG
jgi:hypothetical protein